MVPMADSAVHLSVPRGRVSVSLSLFLFPQWSPCVWTQHLRPGVIIIELRSLQAQNTYLSLVPSSGAFMGSPSFWLLWLKLWVTVGPDV